MTPGMTDMIAAWLTIHASRDGGSKNNTNFPSFPSSSNSFRLVIFSNISMGKNKGPFLLQQVAQLRRKKLAGCGHIRTPNRPILVVMLLFGGGKMHRHFGRNAPIQQAGGKPVVLRRRQAEPKFIGRHLARLGILGKAAQEWALHFSTVGAQSLQTRLQPPGFARDASVNEIRPEPPMRGLGNGVEGGHQFGPGEYSL